MSLIYKCDICDKPFKPDINYLNKQYIMTICPKCMRYFVEYINKHYTDKNKQIKEAYTNETNN